MKRRVLGCLFFTALVGLVLLVPKEAAAEQSLPPCDDHVVPHSVSAAPIRLITNKKRPTITIALGDKQSADGTVVLNSKPLLGDLALVAAEINNTPVRGASELDGVSLGAAPNSSGTGVIVHACVTRGEGLGAGRYEGSIRVYGPELKFFDYPVAVTVKSSRIWAALLLIAGVIGAVVVAIHTKVVKFARLRPPRNPHSRKPRTLMAKLEALVKSAGKLLPGILFRVIAVGFAVAAGLLTYFSVYASNATWGEDMFRDAAAMFVGGFTATTTALLAFVRRMTPEEDTTQAPQPSSSRPKRKTPAARKRSGHP